jgi:hypothetical protein
MANSLAYPTDSGTKLPSAADSEGRFKMTAWQLLPALVLLSVILLVKKR